MSSICTFAAMGCVVWCDVGVVIVDITVISCADDVGGAAYRGVVVCVCVVLRICVAAIVNACVAVIDIHGGVRRGYVTSSCWYDAADVYAAICVDVCSTTRVFVVDGDVVAMRSCGCGVGMCM